ncbi:hypothetical protein FACS189434_05500 [Bacteroidia bacterium]|nr:hypothetical protein FACS189434_05500 [Bacteroidia bacterium]
MKNLRSIFYCVLTALVATVVLSGCGKDDDKKGPVVVVEDGFYVVGDATSIANLKAADATKGLMAAGTDENKKQTVRDGMYEKYIALEAGKPFQLVLKAGASETTYGAALEEVSIADNDQPSINIYKGVMTENATLQVAESGLYHIVLDLNKDGLLSDKLIVVAPVKWGVRGAMNSWGYTEFATPTFNKTTMTYKLDGVTVTADGGFKFSYGGGWKIELNAGETTLVKANTNLGNTADTDDQPLAGLKVGGTNIGITRGVYTIELTWNLANGNIGNSFTAKLTPTGTPDAVNYTDCELELVGTGVANGNAGATPDLSEWGWGNVLSAGKPIKAGDVYTWTWANVELVGGEGFKLRTIGAAASGGVDAFNYGAEIITSAPDGTSTSSDIVVTEDANYTLVLTADAAAGTFKLVITKL